MIGGKVARCFFFVEARVNKRLTPRTPNLEVGGWSLARRVASLDKEFYSTSGLLLKGWGPGISFGCHEYNPRPLP